MVQSLFQKNVFVQWMVASSEKAKDALRTGIGQGWQRKAR